MALDAVDFKYITALEVVHLSDVLGDGEGCVFGRDKLLVPGPCGKLLWYGRFSLISLSVKTVLYMYMFILHFACCYHPNCELMFSSFWLEILVSHCKICFFPPVFCSGSTATSSVYVCA